MKVVALLCCLVTLTSGGRILAILPHFGVTHWASFRPLVEELAIRGHDVTVVTPFTRDQELKNYREISIASSYPKTMEYVSFVDMEQIYRYSVLELYPLYLMAQMTDKTFERKEVLALANEKFDLVILELFNTEIYHALAHKIKAPVIAICSHQITGWGTYVPSTPDHPSYVAHSLAFRSAPFTFFGRLMNILELIIVKTIYLFVFIPSSQLTAEKHLGKIPDISELCQNTSLVFLNAHFSINNPRPHNPNVIEVGGINVVPPKPLPKGLRRPEPQMIPFEVHAIQINGSICAFAHVKFLQRITLNFLRTSIAKGKFDLVIIELFNAEIYHALAHKIKAPMIATLYLFVFIPSSQRTAEKRLGKIPDISELLQNASLVILNAHFSINNPRPHSPNVIELCGKRDPSRAPPQR